MQSVTLNRVELTPTDWFVMFDKFFARTVFHGALKGKLAATRKKLSKVHYALDRKIPESSRVALALSGSVVTKITKKEVPL